MIGQTVVTPNAGDPGYDWPVTDVNYGSVMGDVSDTLGVASVLASFFGFPKLAFTGIASTIVSIFGGNIWNVYYREKLHTSPDGYAYYYEVTIYENSNYTGVIGTTFSDVYFITASPEM